MSKASMSNISCLVANIYISIKYEKIWFVFLVDDF